MDQLSRKFTRANDYEGGNPLRGLIWNIRNDDSIDAARWDLTIIRSLERFADLPTLKSPATMVTLAKAAIAQQVREALVKFVLKNNDALSKQYDAEDKGKILNFVASQALRDREATRVKKDGNRRMLRRRAVTADYVVPEYLRVLYATAAELYPESLARLRQKSAAVMNSYAVVMKTQSQTPVPVFFRSGFNRLNPMTRVRALFLARQLERLRLAYNQLPKPDNGDGAKEREAKTKARNEVKTKYARQLAKLQEFERTGNTERLFIAHPFLGAMRLTAKGALACAKLLKKSDTSEVEAK